MSLHKRIAAAFALATVVTVGSTAFSFAEPGQKGKKPAPAASKAAIAAGKKVYTAQGCAACHKIGSQGGATGPDLTKIGKTWKADKLKTVIRTPQKLTKDAKMPAYGPDKISDKDLKNLVVYLGSLK